MHDNIFFARYIFSLPAIDDLRKSRHTREGEYPETVQLFEENGFHTKGFGNDSPKKDFLQDGRYSLFTTFYLLLTIHYLLLF
jgi:hypothetical protein